MQLGEAIANLNDGIAVYRPDGHLEFCNESFRLINGYSESALKFGVVTYDELGQLDEESEIVAHKPLIFEQRIVQLRKDGNNVTLQEYEAVSYTHLTLPTTPYV